MLVIAGGTYVIVRYRTDGQRLLAPLVWTNGIGQTNCINVIRGGDAQCRGYHTVLDAC